MNFSIQFMRKLLSEFVSLMKISLKIKETVKHFLIECAALILIRQHFFNANNIKDLFENVSMDDIFSFLVIPKKLSSDKPVQSSDDKTNKLINYSLFE